MYPKARPQASVTSTAVLRFEVVFTCFLPHVTHAVQMGDTLM